MIYSPNMKKIFIYGNKMIFYETGRSNCPDLADDQAICSCYYDYTSFNLVSFCLRKIKFWNLLTGKIRLIYDDPMGAEMTSIDVDKTCKRAYLGDNTGRIKIINLKNGALLKHLEPHSTEIKFLIHNQELNIVASCSIDNVIKIHDDKELLQSEVIKEIKVLEDNISALCFSDKFNRLCIGLSNGTLKFYDIEHSHYDSDLDVDSSSIKGEIRVIKELQDLEIILCCYSNGVCTFIVIPPSNAKYKTIYEFNNNINEPISISCVEFDNEKHHLFIGDILGNISCYDISEIYQIVENISNTNNNKGIHASEPIITKENIDIFNNIKIKNIWKITAHEESIRHILYIDIEPRIIVTSSYDLKIKIFSADTGKYKDEFKQIANRIKPIPIGIKFFILNPFGEKDINSEARYIYRKDIANFSCSQINNETSRQHIIEVAKKITEYNAKEKLWLICKNTNLPEYMSNDWKLDINIEKLKAKEEEKYKAIKSQISEIEKITKETEKILMNQSLYSDLYKPKYIEEMKDMDKIKELSDVIQARLRNVKLAVSKANVNYNKIMELSKKQQLQHEKFHNMDARKKRFYSAAYIKDNSNFSGKHSLMDDNSKLSSIAKQLMNKKNIKSEEKGEREKEKEKDEKDEKDEKEKKIDEKEKNEKEKDEKEKEHNSDNNSILKEIMSFSKKDLKKKQIKVRNIKQVLPDIKSQYAVNKMKLNCPNDMFNKYHFDFSEGYQAIFRPFKKLFKKTKESSKHLIRVKSSIILNAYKRKYLDEDKNKKKGKDIEFEIEKEKEYMREKRKKINNLEICLKQLEQNSYI
jgi:WD40 repeat protein